MGTCKVVFPAFGEGGAWSVSEILVFDAVGNRRDFRAADLQAAGFSAVLNVISTQDVTAPNLTGLSFDPTSIDTTSGEAAVTVSISLSDDLSGVSSSVVVFSSPSVGQSRSCNPVRPPAGTLSFMGTCKVVFPAFGEGGAWSVSEILVFDAVGNRRDFRAVDLQAAGFPEVLNVISTQDVTAPNLTGLSFDPTSIDTTSGEATATVSISLSDDLSGVSSSVVVFSSPSGGQSRSCNPVRPPAGTLSFMGTCKVVFPAFGEGGVWSVSEILVFDAVGNRRDFRTADLQAAGFSTPLNVNGRP
jgi:uncharacterized protein (DUF934 family)